MTNCSIRFCQSKRPLCIHPGLWLTLYYYQYFLSFFSSTKYNKDYIHCNTSHCLHSGASADIVMSSWGLERYRAALKYGLCCMVHTTRILIDNTPRTGPFMSVQRPNMFPQPVTFRTQETVTVFLHITDVAEVLLVQVQMHGLLVAVRGTS